MQGRLRLNSFEVVTLDKKVDKRMLPHLLGKHFVKQELDSQIIYRTFAFGKGWIFAPLVRVENKNTSEVCEFILEHSEHKSKLLKIWLCIFCIAFIPFLIQFFWEIIFSDGQILLSVNGTTPKLVSVFPIVPFFLSLVFFAFFLIPACALNRGWEWTKTYIIHELSKLKSDETHDETI